MFAEANCLGYSFEAGLLPEHGTCLFLRFLFLLCVCVSAGTQKPEETVRSPGSRVIAGCEPSMRILGTELGSSAKQYVLLTFEPFTQFPETNNLK